MNLSDKVITISIQNVIELFKPAQLRSYATFNFSIDTEVKISKRVVKDFIVLFGEIGGF